MRDDSFSFETKFCQEYVRDRNGAAAYERAGGKTKSPASSAAAASRLLRQRRVQDKIRELLEKPSNDYQINLQRILQELSVVAYSDITKFLEKDPESGGWTIKQLEDLPPLLTPAIKKLTCTYTDNGHKTTIDLHDKTKALGLLSDYAGLSLDLNKALHILRKYGFVLPTKDGHTFFMGQLGAPPQIKAEDEQGSGNAEGVGND